MITFIAGKFRKILCR